jgi:hypothetical protein
MGTKFKILILFCLWIKNSFDRVEEVWLAQLRGFTLQRENLEPRYLTRSIHNYHFHILLGLI